MTRAQRAWHLRIWLLVAPMIAALVATALLARARRQQALGTATVPACCRTHTLAAGGQP